MFTVYCVYSFVNNIAGVSLETFGHAKNIRFVGSAINTYNYYTEHVAKLTVSYRLYKSAG